MDSFDLAPVLDDDVVNANHISIGHRYCFWAILEKPDFTCNGSSI
jgi:hypothetical protein